jgi:hypothetical protein
LIEASCFESLPLTSIVIPGSVEILHTSCFSNCQTLTSVAFERSSLLLAISPCCFLDSSVQAIYVPDRVEILHDS